VAVTGEVRVSEERHERILNRPADIRAVPRVWRAAYG
jgi:hypothetical protein